MLFPRSLTECATKSVSFIEAPLPSVVDEDCTYLVLVRTENFDDETYLNVFQSRCKIPRPVGAYHFRNVEVVDSWMLITSNNDGVIYNLLPGICWEKAHIDQVLQKETFKATRLAHEPPVELLGKYVLLGYPGIFTYGHFLVDISMRIELAKLMALQAGARFLITKPLFTWQSALLATAGISLDDCVAVGETDRFQIEELFVPVITGINGVFPYALADRTFRHMKDVMNAILGGSPAKRDLIFPLYTPLSSAMHPRILDRREHIIDVLQRRFGIDVFKPEQLSFAQEVDKFRNARLIVGECGGVLHNVLWSEGADLVVMAPPGRFNYYHIGIQRITGGRTAILWGQSDTWQANPIGTDSGRFEIDVDKVSRITDHLLSSDSALQVT
jgi:capsular polysaccharide biosynthesis protein